ncbi:unnamed protein product [Hermetia illucens]|uniref:Drebrin-like protein n=1 Tax=Hermetia illucens TaxID=343691 RepID=A0A7R8UHA1_HERIL|nr:drebrin-like protein [Hermetia illucens]CAD7080559.1 unnamed protein product [Hermetia illucens]
MSVNLNKNRDKIIAAWKEVIDDKTATDWALFGYEGQTNDLKLVSTGDGGLEELCDELNSGKIMYAFARIEDPTTSLTKFLLINWQGEGAPVLRKGTCANHIHDVAKLLTGAHLTINARVEDDIDKERLLNKLSKVSSAYSFKETRIVHDEQKTPIGTNYNRVIPAKELNPAEMQNFWKKEEEEERERIEKEKERKRLEIIKAEEEQRAREEREHREREKKILEDARLQSAHTPIKTSPQPLSPIKTLDSPTRTMTEAERMRQQRNQEARELIGSRVGTAKAIFTQNTCDGQMQTKTAAPVKPVRNSIAQRINALNSSTQQRANDEETPRPVKAQPIPKTAAPIEIIPETPPIKEVTSTVSVAPNDTNTCQTSAETSTISVSPSNQPTQPATAAPTDEYDEFEDQYSTIKRSPHSKTNSLASPDEPVITSTVQQKQQQQEVPQQTVVSNGNGQRYDPVTEDDILYQDALNDGGLKARALYDYQAADESEITFDPGDIITHIDQIDEGWWQGLGPDGTYGLFPANYVELIN